MMKVNERIYNLKAKQKQQLKTKANYRPHWSYADKTFFSNFTWIKTSCMYMPVIVFAILTSIKWHPDFRILNSNLRLTFHLQIPNFSNLKFCLVFQNWKYLKQKNPREDLHLTFKASQNYALKFTAWKVSASQKDKGNLFWGKRKGIFFLLNSKIPLFWRLVQHIKK